MMYPSARDQNDEAVAPLSGACLYTGMYAGAVYMSVEHWRFTGGAAGSIWWYGLLGTKMMCLKDPSLVSLWSSLFHFHFPNIPM